MFLHCGIDALTSLEVQEEPAVAEVEVCVVSVLLHQLKELRVQNLKRFDRIMKQKHTHTHTV